MPTQTTERVKAHGLTDSNLAELRAQQAASEAPKTKKGSRRKDYEFPEYEAHLVHVELEQRLFSNTTGEKLSTPSVQKFTPREFEEIKKSGSLAGYTTEVLHSPEDTDVELGAAGEGVRQVHSNYAALQEMYEGLTGETPDPSLTEAQLAVAVHTARKMAARVAAPPLKPIDVSQALKQNVSPAQPILPQELGEGKAAVAEAARLVGESTPPTTDGFTSVGQITPAMQIAANQQAEEAEAKEVDPDTLREAAKVSTAKKEAAPKTGRRGAAPSN